MEKPHPQEPKVDAATQSRENTILQEEKGSHLRDRNKNSIATSSEGVTPPPVLGTSGMNPLMGSKLNAINSQKEHLDAQQAINQVPIHKRNITADQIYHQNHAKRMPVELRVGVTMQNPDFEQAETQQTLLAENIKTQAESNTHYQYNSQQISNQNAEESNVFFSTNQPTLRNYFVNQGNRQFMVGKASDMFQSPHSLTQQSQLQRVRTQQNGRVKKNMQSFEKGQKLASANNGSYWETSQLQNKNKIVTGRAMQNRNLGGRYNKSSNQARWRAVNSHVLSMGGSPTNASQKATENLGQVLGQDTLGYVQFLSSEAERKATSTSNFPKYTKTTRVINSESSTRQHAINKRLLNDIQRKVPIYSKVEFGNANNSGSSIDWHQNQNHQMKLELQEGLETAIPPNLLGSVQDEFERKDLISRQQRLNVKQRQTAPDLVAEQLRSPKMRNNVVDHSKMSSVISKNRHSFNPLDSQRESDVKTESRVQSSGITPRAVILGEMKSGDFEKTRQINMNKSYRSSRNIIEIRRNQISQGKIDNLLYSTAQMSQKEKHKLSPDRMNDKTIEFQKKWSEQPLKVLNKLEKEIFLNYDMFEKPDRAESPRNQGEEPIEKDQIILMIQQTFEKALEVRQLPYPQVDIDKVLMEASLLYRRIINHFKDDQEISLGLSMLWKYVLTMLDCVLYKNEQELDNFKKHIDRKVEDKLQIALFDNQMEILDLKQQIEDKTKIITEKDHSLHHKTEYMRQLQDNLKKVHATIDGLRDPSGMRDFRKLLMRFDQDLDHITAEKETQYSTMKQVVNIMETMGKEKALAESKLAQAAKEREMLAKENFDKLQKEKKRLQEEMERNKRVSVTLKNPEKELRRQRRQTMIAQMIETKQHHLQQIKDQPLSNEYRTIIKGTGLDNEEAMQGLKIIIAQDLEPLIEKKVRGEMELMFKAKMDRILNSQDKEDSKSSKASIKATKQNKQDNSIASMLQDFFLGKSDISKAVQEKQGGIIEVNEEYLDSETDSRDSVTSAISAASKKSKRTNRNERNTISGTMMGKKRNKSNNLKVEVNSRDDSNESQSITPRGTKTNKNRRMTMAPATALPQKGPSLFLSNRKQPLERPNSSKMRRQDSQRSNRSSKRGGRSSKNRVNFDHSDESESNLSSKISVKQHSSNKKKSINVTQFDRSPTIIPGQGGRLKPNINVNDDSQFFSPTKEELALHKKLSLVSKESLGTQIRNSFANPQGSLEYNKSLDRATSFHRKSILKNSVGESGREETDQHNYTPNHFELNRNNSAAGLLKEKPDYEQQTQVNLKRMNTIKSQVKEGLEKALASQKSKVVIKKTIKDMKNPILSSIKKTLSLPNHKLTKDYFVSMEPFKILKILDEIMQEKVIQDLENEDGPISTRTAAPFHQFLYDSMIMRFGLQSIAIKTLIQMSNGLKEVQGRMLFAHLLNKMLGLGVPPLRLDEIQIVLRTHIFFRNVQEDWINRTRTNHKYLELNKDNEANLNTGGDVLIFDALEEIKIAFKHDKEIQERLLTNLKPDILLQKQENRQHLELRYSILKVTNKIAKMGKDARWVFQQFDIDGNGTLDAREILLGIKNVLGIYFSRDETNMFTLHLDADNSGDIDINEFQSKINLNDLHKESHKFRISEVKLIDQVLSEWYHYKSREQKKVLAVVQSFDKNDDGVMQLDEFQEVLRKLEPGVDKKRILAMFKEALSYGDTTMDSIDPEVLVDLIIRYKLGGYGKEFFSQYLKRKKKIAKSKEMSKTQSKKKH